MTTLTDLQAQRAALLRRMASLQSRVTFGDRTVEYDLSTAAQTLDRLDREIANARTAEGAAPAARFVHLTGRSGY